MLPHDPKNMAQKLNKNSRNKFTVIAINAGTKVFPVFFPSIKFFFLILINK